MTLRHLHYTIFGKKMIPYQNNLADYKRLSRATTVARRLHREWELYGSGPCPEYAIPNDWLVDELRSPEVVNCWDNVKSYLETVERSYRRDNWQDQAQYCEVWSEKGTILGAIRPVADELGLTLRVCRGFSSTGMEAEIGRTVENITKPITVFFLGDHDPSGRLIEHDIHRRAQTASGVQFGMIRLAIHPEDIQRFSLPPQTIKPTDTRAAAFRQQYGGDAPTVELDALPVDELRSRIRNAVTALIDQESWQRQLRVQKVEIACIVDFVHHVKNLPQAEV